MKYGSLSAQRQFRQSGTKTPREKPCAEQACERWVAKRRGIVSGDSRSLIILELGQTPHSRRPGGHIEVWAQGTSSCRANGRRANFIQRNLHSLGRLGTDARAIRISRTGGAATASGGRPMRQCCGRRFLWEPRTEGVLEGRAADDMKQATGMGCERAEQLGDGRESVTARSREPGGWDERRQRSGGTK